MSGINSNSGLSSVIAITRQEDEFKAVLMRRTADGFELVEAASVEAGAGWQAVYERMAQTSHRGLPAVVAFDSANVAFYRLMVPEVKDKELESIVKLQAEALLPLPIEQMQLAWQTGRTQDGHLAVTIAAGRTEQLQRFVNTIKDLKPSEIVLDCEALTKAWMALYRGAKDRCALLKVGRSRTQVCLVEFGRLTGTVTLDTGTDDCQTAQGGSLAGAERFVQDVRGALQLFVGPDAGELPTFIFSDGSQTVKQMVNYLSTAGVDARAVRPAGAKLCAKGKLSAKTIYEYLVPIGLAITALERDGRGLNIFQRLYAPARLDERRQVRVPLRLASVVAAIMFFVFLLGSYAIDKAALGRVSKHLSGSDAASNVNAVIKQQQLRTIIASQRPDILDLLSKVNTSCPQGLMLDSFSFKKGQAVSIAGQAGNYEQLYKFQKSLRESSGINSVKIRNPVLDEKKGKVNFTISFGYRHFSKAAKRR